MEEAAPVVEEVVAPVAEVVAEEAAPVAEEAPAAKKLHLRQKVAKKLQRRKSSIFAI